MKLKKVLFGLLSTVLLSLGLVRLAAATDPLDSAAPVLSGLAGAPAPDCSQPCSAI